jgi:hypothetical protein
MTLNGYLLVSLDYISSRATFLLVINLFRHRRILNMKPHALKSLPGRGRCLAWRSGSHYFRSNALWSGNPELLQLHVRSDVRTIVPPSNLRLTIRTLPVNEIVLFQILSYIFTTVPKIFAVLREASIPLSGFENLVAHTSINFALNLYVNYLTII